VIRSRNTLANAIPRVFMNDTDEDRKAIQKVIDQIVVYPLADFDGKMKTIDRSEAADIPAPAQQGSGETKWVVPEKFFDEFPEVLKMVPPLPGEGALYAQFRWLMDVAAKDPALKRAIVDDAVATEKEVIAPFFQWKHNGKAAGNGWNRSVNNADWGVDYFDRTGTAKSNMFDNKPNETQYFYTDFDSSGAALDGSKSYAITFPAGQEPPVNGFWSLTLYNDKHLFYPNDLSRYSLGTKNKTLKHNADGSLTSMPPPPRPAPTRRATGCPRPRVRSRSTSAPIGAKRRSSTAPGSRPRSRSFTESWRRAGGAGPREQSPEDGWRRRLIGPLRLYALEQPFFGRIFTPGDFEKLE
jgi:hypothetical protein